jgi:hypothetical protein
MAQQNFFAEYEIRTVHEYMHDRGALYRRVYIVLSYPEEDF